MNDFNYPDNMKLVYPGYAVKGYDKKMAELNKLKASATKWADKVESLKGSGDMVALSEAAEKFGQVHDQYEALKAAIFSGDAFTDQSIEYKPYIPAEYGFSLGDLAGREYIEANRAGIPVDHYNDTTTAEEVAEGGSSTPKNLIDSLTMVQTDGDAVIFDDTLKVGSGTYSDDKDTIDRAFEAAHTRHFINAENKKALEVLTGGKAAVALAAESLQTTINASLCGKAKRNAIIITNKSGFAELDIDVNGVPLVTKDPNGNMIYKGKYMIQELPDEILPDTDSGSPCIIGDIANVLKFFIVREDSLFSDFVDFTFMTHDRAIRKEIISLTTTSDEAYIVGYLA